MSINKEQALAVFHQWHSPGSVVVFTITDTLPSYYDAPKTCWIILFCDKPRPARLQGSRIVAISKSTAEIVCDGIANDEG